ncbi:MAG: hypothetical protein IJ566_05685, partial [Cardiobacteriaceae bacterium]|nr:hypothetical protein [Cardiobacteriaceae bacterium]
MSRRQKIYRQILRFAQDDGSSVWLFYRQPLAKNLALAVILSATKNLCRNRNFSRQAKNFLTGGIYVIYNRSCFIDKAYFLICN